MDLDAWERADAMPEGRRRSRSCSAWASYTAASGACSSAGMRDRAARLAVNDAAGRPRLVLEVAPDGAAAIRFLDASGKLVRTETADAAGGAAR